VTRGCFRAIDWSRDPAEVIIRKICAADSAPGVLDRLYGKSYFLYGAHEEDRLKGAPGQILAQRDGAICRGTVDGAVWITHLKARFEENLRDFAVLPKSGGGGENSEAVACGAPGLKLPARDNILGKGWGRLSLLRFLQRRDEHRAMQSSPQRFSIRTPPAHKSDRAPWWPRLLLQWRSSQSE
jgi:Formyl transferase, C-terminal domain